MDTKIDDSAVFVAYIDLQIHLYIFMYVGYFVAYIGRN